MASILWVPVIFALATFFLYYLSASLPALSTVSDDASLRFPSSLDDLSELSETLTLYKENHMSYVILLFVAAYLYKQTFAIPGSVFMNLLAGALFGVWPGFPLCCLLTAIGATNCYLLSRNFGKHYIIANFPDKMAAIQQKIAENKDGLFFFLLFMRLVPVSPNWFLNIVSPILGIPVLLFFPSVFIGLMPYNFICVQTGCMLSSVRSLDDVLTPGTMLKLLAVSLVALVPGLLIKRIKKVSPDEKRAV